MRGTARVLTPTSQPVARASAVMLRSRITARVAAGHPAAVGLLDPVAVDRVVKKEGEVGEEIERVVLRVGLHGHGVAIRRAPAKRRVEAGPLRAAALAVVDGAEAVEQAGAHRALGDLAGAAPAAA